MCSQIMIRVKMRTRNTELLVWLWMTIWNTSVITTLDGLVMSTTIKFIDMHHLRLTLGSSFLLVKSCLRIWHHLYHLTCKIVPVYKRKQTEAQLLVFKEQCNTVTAQPVVCSNPISVCYDQFKFKLHPTLDQLKTYQNMFELQ